MNKISSIIRHLSENPKFIIAYLFFNKKQINRAEYLRRENKFEKAESILFEILQKQPSNLEAKVTLARIASNKGNTSQAAKIYTQIIGDIQKSHKKTFGLVLRAADAFRADHQIELSRETICRFAPPFMCPDSLVALANCAQSDINKWEGYLNQYLQKQSLSSVTATTDTEKRKVVFNAQPNKNLSRNPLVSVIMSAYNMQEYIKNSIYSILNQSWENLELIVVDDCSSDNTVSIVREIASEDARIKLIQLPINVGTYICRNIGLDMCSGDFVAVHDADDWCHPDRIKIQAMDLINHSNQLANVCGHLRMTEKGIFELSRWDKYTNQKCLPSIMMRKRPIQELFGYWDSVRVSADSEFWERINKFSHKWKTSIIPKTLVIQLRRTNSLTTKPETQAYDNVVSPIRQDYIDLYRKWHKEISINNCRISFPLQERLFPAPQAITVNKQEVITAISQINTKSNI